MMRIMRELIELKLKSIILIMSFRKSAVHVIDVTNRAVEETANVILNEINIEPTSEVLLRVGIKYM